MKIQKAILLDALQKVTRVAPSHPLLPVLSHVGFDEERERIYCTDLEKWIFANVQGLDFSACIPARLLADLVKNVRDEIEIEQQDDAVILSAGRQKSVIKTLPFSEMPYLSREPEEWTPVPANFLADIDKVVFSAATDEGRPVLTGVLVTPDGRMTATDGYRLSTTGVAADGVIVPAKALAELPRLFGGSSLEQSIARNQIAFRDGNTMFVSQLLEGNFPNAAQIIPKNSPASCRFQAADAIHALKAVLVLADKTDIVEVSCSVDEILLSAWSEDGKCEARFTAQAETFEPFAVNGRFLLQALQTMKEATMLLGSPTRPILLQEGDNQQVIMPMQVRKR